MPTPILYWFRNDLRLADNPALLQACRAASSLLPVVIDLDTTERTRWDFARVAPHRQAFRAQAIADLDAQLRSRGSRLLRVSGEQWMTGLLQFARRMNVQRVMCEVLPAPEEEAQVAALRAAGLTVECIWQSSLLEPAQLPFAPEQLPDVFTPFRHAVEKAKLRPAAPLPAPETLPPLPPLPLSPSDVLAFSASAGEGDLVAAMAGEPASSTTSATSAASTTAPASTTSTASTTSPADPRSAFPYHTPAFHGGERAAQAHLTQYFARRLAHSYKATRDRLHGIDDSSKFSPWLSTGALSARQIYAALKAFEAEHGANDGSYWLWFELLWRDYFRLLQCKYGRRLYRASGLRGHAAPPHDARAFARWCAGETGEPLIDAGMRELAATGFLSNRMRQIVASYLVHDLACDWRAGAAWFEAQLVDYDVCSNHGNWLYLAGLGTDPRGGRRFDVQKQAAQHDPAGSYRERWKN